MIPSADVVIVGAGPAGTALAALLGRCGIESVLLDRAVFPRPKPCGETLNPGAVEALRRLDLLGPVMRRGPASIAGWSVRDDARGGAGGRYAGGHGLGIARASLDAALLDAARPAARVREGVRVTGVEAVRRGGYVVAFRDRTGAPGRTAARFLVGADGLRSRVSRALGLLRRRPGLRKVSLTCRLRGTGPAPTRGLLQLGQGVTVGLAPVSAREPLWNGTVVLRSEPFGRAVAADPMGVFRRALADAGFPWDRDGFQVVEGPWASGPFDRSPDRVVADDALLVGDAAGYFDPLTGQGICQALRSAELAARQIEMGFRRGATRARDLAWYHGAIRREGRRVRTFQRAVEAVVSRRAPRRAALRVLGGAPRYMDRIIRVAGDAAPMRALARIDLLLHGREGRDDR